MMNSWRSPVTSGSRAMWAGLSPVMHAAAWSTSPAVEPGVTSAASAASILAMAAAGVAAGDAGGARDPEPGRRAGRDERGLGAEHPRDGGARRLVELVEVHED